MHLRIPLTFCGILLTVAESRTTGYIRLLRNPRHNNPADKFTLQLLVRGIHGKFASGIHLHFRTCLKISFWNPGTCRHKIARLSSAQFGLVMKNHPFFESYSFSKMIKIRLEIGLKCKRFKPFFSTLEKT